MIKFEGNSLYLFIHVYRNRVAQRQQTGILLIIYKLKINQINAFIRFSSVCVYLKRYIDINLLKEPMFIGMCISVTLMSTGCPYMLYFLPAYALSAGK